MAAVIATRTTTGTTVNAMSPVSSTITHSSCRGARPIAPRKDSDQRCNATAATAAAIRSFCMASGRSTSAAIRRTADCRGVPSCREPVIDSMLDIMPSRGLVIHEYRTHGTCSGLDPERYFATAHRLFDGITIPQRFRNPLQSQTRIAIGRPQRVPTRQSRRSRDNMMAVVCGGARGSLKEIRFCFSKDGKPRACGQNENQRKLCSADRFLFRRHAPRHADDASRSRSAPVIRPKSEFAASRSAHGFRLSRPLIPLRAR